MNNLTRLDSFIREGLRFYPGAVGEYSSLHLHFLHFPDLIPSIPLQPSLTSPTVNIDRLTLKPVTLSDGTYLPRGAFVSVAMGPMMKDPELSAFGPTAGEFDGFRFSEKRVKVEGEENRNQIVQIGNDFLPFGMGRHAWFVFHILFLALPCMLSVPRTFLYHSFDIFLVSRRNALPFLFLFLQSRSLPSCFRTESNARAHPPQL